MLRKVSVALAAAVVMTAAVMNGPAQAVPFSVTGASFTPGTGYGIDANEATGTLLDVRFSTAGFATQSFSLNLVGDTFSFTVGSINLQEPNSNGGINANETDNLAVTAHLTFSDPLASVVNIVATGTAILGSISDAQVDYTLIWTPVFVDFGIAGQFEVLLQSLSFNNVGTQIQMATVRLLHLPVSGPSGDVTVPEPGTLFVLGLGLAGLGMARRRRLI